MPAVAPVAAESTSPSEAAAAADDNGRAEQEEEVEEEDAGGAVGRTGGRWSTRPRVPSAQLTRPPTKHGVDGTNAEFAAAAPVVMAVRLKG